MQRITLFPMTRELYHMYYKGFRRDPSIYADMSLYKPFVYDFQWVERYRARQEEKGRLVFAILREGEPVGEILLKDIDLSEKSCTLSIHLQHDGVKGQGIGSQAERLLLDYAVHHLGMQKVYADTIHKNTRSQHVLEKVGFRYTGEDEMLRYYVYSPGPLSELRVLEEDLSVCKLRRREDFHGTNPYSLTDTGEELSLVCKTADVPAEALAREDGWRAFRIEGVLDFSLIGILSGISGALAEAGIGLFAISTYNTDTILVKAENLSPALEVMSAKGYTICTAGAGIRDPEENS